MTKSALADETAQHFMLANTAFAKGDYAAARVHYEAALTRVPNFPEALHNYGDLLIACGETEAALRQYHAALSMKPHLAKTRYSLATAQLLTGNFADGWQNYEYRWGNKDLPHPEHAFDLPLWDGTQLAGQKLLLWGEQGIGDEIMFAGFIPAILAAGAAVTIRCANSRLLPLFQRSFPAARVCGDMAGADFDAHLPLGNLPAICCPNLFQWRAPQAYLKVDDGLRDRLAAKYGSVKKRIGLVWHSESGVTGRQRSIDFDALAPLLTADAHLINLQYGEAAKRGAEKLFSDPEIDQMQNLDAFAAQIAAMDLVITIDSACAHIAGALGVPVWLMLPAVPDWRWFMDRADSIWYPSITIFRQSENGKWDDVISHASQKLKTEILKK